MHISRENIIQEFNNYVSNYNAEQKKIKMKIDHTYRVAANCQQIAESLMLSSEDIDLAWLCGMLHDIGRFEQIKRYDTFVDAQSVDHAKFGADLLFKESLIDSFIDKNQQKACYKELDILEKSIRNHSLYRLNEDLDDTTAMFCNIVRDADKLDIFKVMYDSRLEDIYNVETEVLEHESVTAAVKQCFIEKHAVLRSLKQTAIDNLVGHICLFYELVYDKSRTLAKEQGYLSKIVNFKSKNEDTNKWFEYMRDTLG